MRDPDGNGVELYWDRPKELWPLSVASCGFGAEGGAVAGSEIGAAGLMASLAKCHNYMTDPFTQR